MRKAVLVLLSTLALVLGLAAQSATAAGKPAYGVTLKTSVTTSVAAKFLTVSGKVTGPKAVGRSVTIQRKYVGGSWTNVAFATVRSNGTYSARVETPRGGTTSFRALKGKSSVRKAGTSPVRAIPVYQWINLASQSGMHNSSVLSNVQGTVSGKSAPSILIYGNSDITYKLGGICTKLTTVADYQDDGAAQSVDLQFYKTPYGGGSTTSTDAVVTKGTPVTVSSSLTGARLLTIETTNFDSGYQLIVFGPKVYCNADVLPAWTTDELK